MPRQETHPPFNPKSSGSILEGIKRKTIGLRILMNPCFSILSLMAPYGSHKKNQFFRLVWNAENWS
jgi:hypothetical protein